MREHDTTRAEMLFDDAEFDVECPEIAALRRWGKRKNAERREARDKRACVAGRDLKGCGFFRFWRKDGLAALWREHGDCNTMN